MTKVGRAALIYGLLLAIFTLFMAWFFHSITVDPPGSFMDESPSTKGYGRNHKGEYLWTYFMAVEFLVLLAILAPHKGHRHWGLVLTGFIMAALWTIMMGFGIMHSSPVYGIHLIWMVTVSTILMFALILGFFDRNYHLPDGGSLRTQVYRSLVILFSALLAGVFTIAIIAGGFTALASLI